METEYVLADQVVDHRPPFVEAGLVLAVADSGGVVDKSVIPHVEHMLFVPWHLYAPVERGSGYRNILKPCLDKPDGLIAFGLGADRFGVVRVPLQETVGKCRKAEKVVVFLEQFDGPAVYRAKAVDEVALGVIGLARHAIKTFVGPDRYPATVIDSLHQGANRGGGAARWCG